MVQPAQVAGAVPLKLLLFKSVRNEFDLWKTLFSGAALVSSADLACRRRPKGSRVPRAAPFDPPVDRHGLGLADAPGNPSRSWITTASVDSHGCRGCAAVPTRSCLNFGWRQAAA